MAPGRAPRRGFFMTLNTKFLLLPAAAVAPIALRAVTFH